MTLEIENRVAATRRRTLLGGILAAVVLAAAAVIAVISANGNHPTPSASPDLTALQGSAGTGAAASQDNGSGSTASPGSSTPQTRTDTSGAPATRADESNATAANPQGDFVAPARRVILPAGNEQVDEYPVKFPHTPEGAAAVAVAMTRYSASLDYDTASEVLRLYAAPQYTQQADAAGRAAVQNARTRLGLSADGPAPQEASFVAEPTGVQWHVVDADEVTVSVLAVTEYRLADKVQRELISAQNKVIWSADQDDWRLAPLGPGQLGGPKAAELGTPQFNDNGWSAVATVRQ